MDYYNPGYNPNFWGPYPSLPFQNTLDQILTFILKPRIYAGTWKQGMTYQTGEIVLYGSNFYELQNIVVNAQLTPLQDTASYTLYYALSSGALGNIVTPEEFGAIGNGIVDDTAALQTALNTGRDVVCTATYLSGTVNITSANQNLLGSGSIKARAGTGTLLNITGDNVTVNLGSIDANGCTYAVFSTGVNTLVENIRFLGNVGHYAFLAGINGTTKNNYVTPGYNQITPFVHSANGAAALHNILDDHTGFGIQFRFLTGGIMAGNRSKNPTYSASLTATADQTVFVFNLGRVGCVRFATLDNGAQRAFTSVVDNGNGNYTVTFPTGSTISHIVTLYGWRALETYQCNSNCYDVTIDGNVSDGTGDSCIVIAADYHDGVLDPGSVTEVDYADRIVVSNNTCRNSLANGVAGLLAKGVTVTGNTVSEFGYAFDPALVNNAAISVTGCLNSTVNGNVLESSSSGRTQYGIAGWRDYNSGETPDFRDFEQKASIGINTFSGGAFTSRYFQGIGLTSTTRRYGVDIAAGAWLLYPQEMQVQFDAAQTVPGVIDSSPYWEFSTTSGAAPAGRDTTNKIGGVAAITVPAGQIFQIVPLAADLFKNCLVKISFLARKTGINAGGRVDVFYDNGTGLEPRIRMQVMSTVFEEYELILPVSAIGGSGFFFRVGDSGATTTTTFQYIQIMRKPLDIS